MRRALRILACGSPDALNLFMAVGAIWWGVFLALTPNTFDNSRLYDVMAQIGSEMFWASAVALSGVFDLYTLLYSRSQPLKATAHFVMFVTWSVVGVSFAVAEWQSTGTPIYVSFAMAAFWMFTRTLAFIRERANGPD